MLAGWIETLMLGGAVVLPAGVTVLIGGDGTEFQNRLGTVKAPASSADVEAVGDEVACGSFEDPGGDGPAGLEGSVVVEEPAKRLMV
ncbi:hypothetical protein KGS77_00190 [Streptomyces sp. MST-110588]|nr:hypothetical protein KGS77_00190 [Streptomyces sp. MST-110588]